MILKFENKSKYVAVICINDMLTVFANPHNETTVNFDCDDVELTIAVRLDKNSCLKSGIYHMVLETVYRYSAISTTESFIITREKVRFSGIAFYERFFMSSSNAICLSEYNHVLNEEYLKKKFKSSQRLNVFEPLSDSILFPIVWLFAGILLWKAFGWITGIVYYIISYLLLYLLTKVADSLSNKIFGKIFGVNKEKEFYDFFKNEFIAEYYSNVNRKPFIGKVDTE